MSGRRKNSGRSNNKKKNGRKIQSLEDERRDSSSSEDATSGSEEFDEIGSREGDEDEEEEDDDDDDEDEDEEDFENLESTAEPKVNYSSANITFTITGSLDRFSKDPNASKDFISAGASGIFDQGASSIPSPKTRSDQHI